MKSILDLLYDLDDDATAGDALGSLSRRVPATPADLAHSLAAFLPMLLDGELDRDAAERWAKAIGLGAIKMASASERIAMMEAEVDDLRRRVGLSVGTHRH